MSFTVFGASKEEAEKLAKKRLSSIEKSGLAACEERVFKWKFDRVKSAVDRCVEDVAKNNAITPENYQAAIDELKANYIKKMKEKQISPLYGSPQCCSEFIELAKRAGAKRMLVRQRVRQPSAKKPGTYETVWQQYPPQSGATL
jgi:hypothetical protein